MRKAIHSLPACEADILAEYPGNQALSPSVDFLYFVRNFWQFKRIVSSRFLQRTDFNCPGIADRCKSSDGFHKCFRHRGHHISNNQRKEIRQTKTLFTIGIRDVSALYCVGFVFADFKSTEMNAAYCKMKRTHLFQVLMDLNSFHWD